LEDESETTMTTVPEDHLDLLERPVFAHLATVRPDGSPQVNPMWFVWDGEVVRFTHTDERQKFRNLKADPRVAISIQDPENPYRYLEVRGVVSDISPDPEGAFYRELAVRYGRDRGNAPRDAAHRVIIAVALTHSTWM
jgi:PPOX class probable F420-dependent enzyme